MSYCSVEFRQKFQQTHQISKQQNHSKRQRDNSVGFTRRVARAVRCGGTCRPWGTRCPCYKSYSGITLAIHFFVEKQQQRKITARRILAKTQPS